MGEIAELPVQKRNKSVDECLIESQRINMSECLVVGWKGGDLVVNSAKNMNKGDALWLLEAAKMDIMNMKPTMYGKPTD